MIKKINPILPNIDGTNIVSRGTELFLSLSIEKEIFFSLKIFLYVHFHMSYILAALL